ncbi:MAG: hypothetical protein JXE06_02920 [Coriobacteriia bacterium]|nr:hypothetical protein [Coriobacteriia bacterium]MBN2822395.1 hypothetical protein [Coriobacteriia bacterium]
MVKKETCPVCKGNKIVKVEHASGESHRSCPGCNGAGYKVSIVHLSR